MNELATDTPGQARGTIARGERLFGFVEASHARAIVVLLMMSLAAFLPGFAGLQPMDRDEPRFAQATKQMLETGDFVSIRFQDAARNKKPVGIHWLQAVSVAAAEHMGVPAARTTIALYRLPSLLGAVAAVLLTYWAALALVGRREAFLAAAFMAASLLLIAEAHLAKTDAVLTACCVGAMGGLARAYIARDGTLSLSIGIGFWLAVGLSAVVKGPIGPMIVGLTALVLAYRERSGRFLRALRPGLGLVIVLAITAPWFVAIAIETKGAFFLEAVGQDMLAKVGSGQERHGAPPGTYLVVFFATFWPAAPFAALAVPTIWRERRHDAVAFCLAWTIPAWLVFELVPTKLPHYVLPLYPAIAILTTRALCSGAIVAERRGAALVALLLPIIPIGVLAALTLGGLRLDHALPFVAMPFLGAAAALAILGWFIFRRGDPAGAAQVGVLAGLVLSLAVFGIAHTMLRSLKLSPRLAEAAASLDCPSPRYATVGYREPSLVFLLGTDLLMTDGSGAAAFLAGGPCRVALVETKDEKAFADAAVRHGASPSLVTRVRGFNINGGRELDIGVYAARP